jgi:cytochrome c553
MKSPCPKIRLTALLTGALMLTAQWALAERHGMLPQDAPPSYFTECSSCHEAPPPDMLTANPWSDMMLGLNHHFGVDANIDNLQTYNEINAFLSQYAYQGRASSLRPMRNGDPMRITTTLYFHRTHGRVKSHFHDPQVVSAFNCSACHLKPEGTGYNAKALTPLSKQFLSEP